ncbi:hypothetical protein [Senegalia massiliensis]|uniref:hypothetical protein n=1 Tax=Senegalia massiliensis TaxID=1720316 RepID=UPI0010312BBA|nr:hypothetical protein [Senegalia massiliensis]
MEFSIFENVNCISLKEKTIMTGLIDSHVHITMEPIANPVSLMSKKSASKTTLQGVANLKKHLYSDTTFCRD